MKNKLIVSTGSLFALLLWSNSSFAACKLQNQKYVAQEVLMDIGNIVINPDAAIGTILGSASPAIRADPGTTAVCDLYGGTATGILLQNKPVSSYDAYTYTTNISGIGIKLYRELNGNKIYYPHTYPVSSGSQLGAGRFVVEIIKIGPITQTGALTSGLYSTYYLDGDGAKLPALTSRLNASGIVITNPTCTYRDNTDGQTVELDKVGVQELNGVGSVAKPKVFSIKFSCSGGDADKKLNLTFAYTPDPSAGANGVMKNTTGSGYATGVGIQILKDDATTKVKNGDKLSVATITKKIDSIPELKLKAQYYQTAAQVTAGKVYTTATVTISYE